MESSLSILGSACRLVWCCLSGGRSNEESLRPSSLDVANSPNKIPLPQTNCESLTCPKGSVCHPSVFCYYRYFIFASVSSSLWLSIGLSIEEAKFLLDNKSSVFVSHTSPDGLALACCSKSFFHKPKLLASRKVQLLLPHMYYMYH